MYCYGADYASVSKAVYTVRAERLEVGAEPALVIEDLFVDSSTGFARRESTTRIKLKEIARGPGNVTLYAFREPQHLSIILSAPGGNMVGPTTDANSLGCGMARVALATSGRTGVAASFALGLPNLDTPADLENLYAGASVPMARALRVSVSLSQVSRDPSPVLSVSFGRPSPPVEGILEERMPRWNELLSEDELEQLQKKVASRD